MTAKNTRTARTAARNETPSFLIREKKGEAPTAILAVPAPTIKSLKAAEDELYGVAADFLLHGKREEIYKPTWGESLKSHRSFYRKLCDNVKPADARAAWNKKVESADRKTKLSISGLLAACKAAGLIEPGKAPAPKAEAQSDDGGEDACMALADSIVSILSGKGNPATKLAAIRALPDIMDAMDRAADA